MPLTIPTERYSGFPTAGYPIEVETNADLKIRWVDDLLVNMDDMSTDLLKYLGGPAQFTFNNNKLEWVEDEPWNRRVIGTMPAEGGGGGTTITLAAATSAHNYPIGTLLIRTKPQAGGGQEVVRVTDAPTAATLTVVRDLTGVGGPCAAWLATDEVLVAGTSMAEDAAWEFRAGGLNTMNYNYAQYMSEAIHVTFARMETPLYGLRGTDLDDMTQDCVARHFVQMEEGLVLGQRLLGTAATAPPMFGGINYFLGAANTTTVVDLATVAFTRRDLDDILQNLFYAVGPDKMARTCVVSAWAKRKISSWFSAAEHMNSGAGQTGGITVDRINTDFGVLDFMLHTAIEKNAIYFLNRNNIKMGNFGTLGRPHLIDPAGVSRTGPYVERFYYGCLSVMVKGIAGMGKLYNFSLTT